MPAFYPPLTPEVLRTLSQLKALTDQDPDYFKHPDCPYPAENIAFLESLYRPGVEAIPPDETDSGGIDLEKEARTLFQEIKTFKSTLGSDSSSEKAQMFRVSTSLMEKLLEITERSKGVKQFEEFKTLILDSMDRYLTPQQKSEFVDEIEKLLGES